MTDLSVTVDGLRLPNPFVIASGPPGTNARVIARAFDEGWGGVVCKTICLESEKIVNVAPRYSRLRAEGSREIYGWENIELISDRPIGVWERELRDLKRAYPGRVLIASVMDEYRREAWHEIVERIQATGVDALELNLSCPHGLPERGMGSTMGQNPEMTRQVCAWVKEVARVPFWAKLTPNITQITEPGRAALIGGADGLSAINTILCVMGIDLETLRPKPSVEGYSTPGGYSSKAILPIAMRMVVELATMAREARLDRSLSAIGGVESGEDAAQFVLCGAHTVQICTGVMKHGYGLIHQLRDGLRRFMERHGFGSVDEFRGRSLEYFTTHAELVRLQREAKDHERAKVRRDGDWSGDEFVGQSDSLVSA